MFIGCYTVFGNEMQYRTKNVIRSSQYLSCRLYQRSNESPNFAPGASSNRDLSKDQKKQRDRFESSNPLWTKVDLATRRNRQESEEASVKEVGSATEDRGSIDTKERRIFKEKGRGWKCAENLEKRRWNKDGGGEVHRCYDFSAWFVINSFVSQQARS